MKSAKTAEKLAFNQSLLEKEDKVDGGEYLIQFHQKIRYEVKTPFLNQFLEMCNSTEPYCIHQSKLVEFGVSSDDTSNIRRYIKSKNSEENIDYIIVTKCETDSLGRNVTKQEFILNTFAFKTCLIGSQNTRVYRDYFLLLEDIWKNYLDYEKQYNEISQKRILAKKDSQIEMLIRKLDENNINFREQNIKLDETVVEVKNLNETNKKLYKSNKKMNRKLDTINVKVHQMSPSVVSTPLNKKKIPEFMLLQSKNDDKQFLVVCGKNEYITMKEIKSKPGYEIMLREYNANPDTFYDIIRERIDNYNSQLNNLISECNYQLKESNEDKEELNEIIRECCLSLIKYNNKELILGEDCDIDSLLRLIDEARNEPKNLLYETFEVNPLRE